MPRPVDVFHLLESQPGAAWLDGGPWSILAWDPETVVTDPTNWPTIGDALGRPRRQPPLTPFASGVLGYIGFGAGAQVAPVPTEASTWEPPIWLGRYDGVLAWHRPTGRWFATGSAGRQRDAQRLLDKAGPAPSPPPAPRTVATTCSAAAFEDGVRAVQALIRQGDCYQVNLTRPVWVEGVDHPWAVYRRLRASQAGNGAYLRTGPDTCILSNSPEQLLEVRAGRALSDPIKGTRPRHRDPVRDAQERQTLTDSAKDHAELTMIVDLVRNDLSKVCLPGTVVAEDRRVESHANVHHTHQRVSGRLEPGRTAWDALAACFPPGSVTGAPKIRACQRISELEPHPRGVYCGSIGYVDDAGDAEWSVAIRTAICHQGRARYHVGGGIVIDSDPAEEWQETVDKGTRLARALGHD